MRMENIDRRILGAVRFLDATTGLMIRTPLDVQAPGAHLVRNRSGYYVIDSFTGFDDYIASFQTAPAAGAAVMAGQVDDPDRQYLPRRFSVSLPRDADPANAAQPTSVFRAADVLLFASPVGGVSPLWAVIRAAVTRAGTSTALAGALIRVRRASDNAVLARGISDWRGEALVAVPGIPVTTFGAGPGPVTQTGIDVVVETIYDPAATPPPDPDDLDTRGALPRGTTNLHLVAGETLAAPLTVPLP
jgi:hypothetical protein